MRRLLLPLLGMLLLVSLTGCDDLARLLPQDESALAPPPVYSAPTPEPFPANYTTAARIRERGQLIVGIRYDLEPFSYIAADGGLAGLEIDLAQELARRWLGDPEAVQFRQIRSDTAVQHLLDGDVDIVLAGVQHTLQTDRDIDFSPPYFVNGQALLTFPDTGITGLNDLAGRRVGVVSWTDSQADLQAATQVTATLVPFASYFDVVEALRTRQIDAYADQRHRLERARRTIAGSLIVGQYTFTPFAMGYRENDPFFADLVTLTFQDLAADGARDTLYARWLPETSPPDAPGWRGAAPTPGLNDAPQTLATLDTVEAVRQRGVIEVGYLPDLWPYSADREDGVQTGFEVRLLERMAELWLGSQQAITFVPVTRQNGLSMVQNGELDMLAGGWIHTRDAERLADFSLTVFDDGVSLFTLAGNPQESLEGLAGQAVGVIAGSEGATVLPTLSQAAGVGLNPLTYPDRETALAALNAGEIAALIVERGYVLDPLYREGGYYLSETRLVSRPAAFVLPQGDSDFKELVDTTLLDAHKNGLFTDLYTTWFDDPPPTAPPWPR
ncbi:MAG: transporter substrate-binding domain-containing protein [Anaerolineae bacterium]|nr:transporter substrate-binding domain-containing protein [Anaerolineae bacterium]